MPWALVLFHRCNLHNTAMVGWLNCTLSTQVSWFMGGGGLFCSGCDFILSAVSCVYLPVWIPVQHVTDGYFIPPSPNSEKQCVCTGNKLNGQKRLCTGSGDKKEKMSVHWKWGQEGENVCALEVGTRRRKCLGAGKKPNGRNCLCREEKQEKMCTG